MENNLRSFEPLKLLTQVMAKAQIDAVEQEEIIAAFRLILANKVSAQVLEYVRNDKDEVIALLTDSTLEGNIFLEKLKELFKEKIPEEKLEEIYFATLLDTFADTVDAITKDLSEDRLASIDQILRQDKVISQVYQKLGQQA